MIALLACDFLSVCGEGCFLSLSFLIRIPKSFVLCLLVGRGPGGGDLSCLMSVSSEATVLVSVICHSRIC